MKKLFYLFLTVFIVACSSDDNDNNNSSPIELNPAFVGNWSGYYTGDDFGDVEVVILSNVEVSGFADGVYPIVGSVSENGTLAAGVTIDGYNSDWIGTIRTDGTASGTWSGSGFSGTWAGTKE